MPGTFLNPTALLCGQELLPIVAASIYWVLTTCWLCAKWPTHTPPHNSLVLSSHFNRRGQWDSGRLRDLSKSVIRAQRRLTFQIFLPAPCHPQHPHLCAAWHLRISRLASTFRADYSKDTERDKKINWMLTVKKSSHWHVGKSNHMQFWWLRMSDWFFPLLETPKSVEPKDKGHEWSNGLIAGPSKSLWGDHLKKTEWWYLMENGTGHLQRSEVNSARPQGNSGQNVPRTKCWLGCRQHEHSATVAESINWCGHFGKPFGGACGGGFTSLWPSNSTQRHVPQSDSCPPVLWDMDKNIQSSLTGNSERTASTPSGCQSENKYLNCKLIWPKTYIAAKMTEPLPHVSTCTKLKNMSCRTKAASCSGICMVCSCLYTIQGQAKLNILSGDA